jgi:predicted acetyltransferase
LLTIELQRIGRAERSALDRLLDDYLAELAAHREVPVGAIDAAGYAYLPLYWKEPGRHPLFLVSGGIRVGFVLIREVEREGALEMSEFYIRPASRRAGLGRAALAQIWRRFPGRWRLQVHQRNEAGAAFWTRCIEESASGEIEIREVVEDDGRRIEFSFQIADRSEGSV